jgi:hypothetical protein
MCGKQQAYHTDAQSAASAHNQSAKTLDCRVDAFFQKYQNICIAPNGPSMDIA